MIASVFRPTEPLIIFEVKKSSHLPHNQKILATCILQGVRIFISYHILKKLIE